MIEPKDIWNPRLTVMDKAGTYWYHPHLHENTNLHVSKGSAGFIIVRDGEKAALNLLRTYGVDDFTRMRLNVVNQTANAIADIPTYLVNPYSILEESADTTRFFSLSSAGSGSGVLNGDFLINDVSFDMDFINETIPLNNIEIWSITNESPIAHPFHIHDVQFYILDRNSVPPSPSETGRKDVVLVKPMETVRFITEFKDFVSDSVPYMYHCHMLDYEDRGMMGQFIVVDESIVGIDRSSLTPNHFSLGPAYPNPFNPQTTIQFQLDEPGDVHLIIYNLNGQEVITLTNDKLNSGTYQTTWSGVNSFDEKYSFWNIYSFIKCKW